MVGKLTYDQVLEIAKDLRAQVEIIERLLENKKQCNEKLKEAIQNDPELRNKFTTFFDEQKAKLDEELLNKKLESDNKNSAVKLNDNTNEKSM